MNQYKTGKFISQKRRELNLTQEQLAEQLNVSNKTVSKWETGKCMPDYAIIQDLCKRIGVTVAELIDGEENENSIHTYDEDQMIDMLRKIQELEKKNNNINKLINEILLVIIILAIVVSCGFLSKGILGYVFHFCLIVMLIVHLVNMFKPVIEGKFKK